MKYDDRKMLKALMGPSTPVPSPTPDFDDLDENEIEELAQQKHAEMTVLNNSLLMNGKFKQLIDILSGTSNYKTRPQYQAGTQIPS
jgi:hypothetical protein